MSRVTHSSMSRSSALSHCIQCLAVTCHTEHRVTLSCCHPHWLSRVTQFRQPMLRPPGARQQAGRGENSQSHNIQQPAPWHQHVCQSCMHSSIIGTNICLLSNQRHLCACLSLSLSNQRHLCSGFRERKSPQNLSLRSQPQQQRRKHSVESQHSFRSVTSTPGG